MIGSHDNLPNHVATLDDLFAYLGRDHTVLRYLAGCVTAHRHDPLWPGDQSSPNARQTTGPDDDPRIAGVTHEETTKWRSCITS